MALGGTLFGSRGSNGCLVSVSPLRENDGVCPHFVRVCLLPSLTGLCPGCGIGASLHPGRLFGVATGLTGRRERKVPWGERDEQRTGCTTVKRSLTVETVRHQSAFASGNCAYDCFVTAQTGSSLPHQNSLIYPFESTQTTQLQDTVYLRGSKGTWPTNSSSQPHVGPHNRNGQSETVLSIDVFTIRK